MSSIHELNDPASNTIGVRTSPEPSEVFRQIFALSMASNALYTSNGIQDDLLQCIQTKLPGIVSAISGQWTVVWGPVIWKAAPDDEETGPSNTWFIAHSPSVLFDDGKEREAYVIAIAGTNAKAGSGGWEQNLGVDRVVDFPAWVTSGITQPPVPVDRVSVVPDGTYVANGTATGVHILLSEHSPPGSASAGLTLYEYLTGIIASESTRVVFTGHSLGGALSPTLALALARSGALKGKALVYPTAGPSPGNGSFANLFAETFPTSPSTTPETRYAVWNRNIINSLDIVPQAWCTNPTLSPAQNMDNIPPIYGVPVIEYVQQITSLLKFSAISSDTVYIPLQSCILPGIKPQTVPETETEFMRVALDQHMAFYSGVFGVEAPELDCKKLTKKTEEEMFLEFPVIGDIEWGKEHRAEVEAAVSALQGE
ncbi:uncharacterized protein EDB91DRAFT_1344694 [Suillus paluster]|uniref:uncharacterized protein n=1 Tax=Suillus paluster TaxID=48578 RepID=UPI001B86BFF0|nr:uncharacterized protein EDB91DRAFT_1344694 [Suillus paluster]KAG1748989.1 hypothetical protein EDB91DRAFT_1344694 [Suillus paluster]